MNLLPYEHFTIETYLGAEEGGRRLAHSVEPKKVIRWFSTNHKPYEGDVTSDSFKISRIIHYRNSFLPQITGSIRSDLGRTLVEIRMALHPVVLVFLVLWLAFFGSIFVGSFQSFVADPGSNASPLVVGVPLMIVMLVVVIAAFKFESSKSKKFLRGLLEDIRQG